ncbi:MAG: TIM-barrel domain-containing protein [Bacteroidota bacterium]|jgi:alpha-D-xyloside xylohydrolase
MRTSIRTGLSILFALGLCFTVPEKLSARDKSPSIELKMNGGYLRIEAYTGNILHVTFSKTRIFKAHSIDVIEPAQMADALKARSGNLFTLRTSGLICEVSKKLQKLSIKDTSGLTVFLEAIVPGELRDTVIQGEKTYSILQQFIITPDEGLYGLGQHQDGVMNWHNKSQSLIQKNMEVALPFLVSTRNYGILWDNPSQTEYKSGETGMSFWSEVADAIDFYVITGKNADEVIAGYRKLTGPVPMLPRWAFGYWQSKERYKSRREILDIASEYRSRNIPIDVIVQDWQYWGKYGWSSMLWDENTYPDPKSMTDSLHKVFNIHYMVSVWPHVQPGCPLAAELDSSGLLFKDVYWNKGRIYDAYSEKARDIYWKHLNVGLFSMGVDGWWLDATEPELNWVESLPTSKKAIVSLGKNSLGTFSRYLNSYPFLTCKGIYENQRKTSDSKRVVILTRSAWLGQQRTGAITWSGDIPSSFKTLKDQVAAGINFSLSGNPYWNTDIGGFFPSGHGGEYPFGITDLAWRELYVRWFQFGVFCPVFRSHGTGTPREMWKFGEPGTRMFETLLQWDQLRYRIMPYIYSMAWKIHKEGYTLMRGLPMDFNADKKVYDIGDEYMFGPSFLVKPVTKQQYFSICTDTVKEQQVIRSAYDSVDFYLPAGSAWFDFFTRKRFEGGQTVLTPSPLEVIPVYIRAGSIIPYAPLMQYTTETPEDPVNMMIFPGADADFSLYEDENDGYNYEKAAYALIPFHWNDKEKTMTIGKREGEFPGMLKTRNFKLTFISPVIPEGFPTAPTTEKKVKYNGSEISVKIK